MSGIVTVLVSGILATIAAFGVNVFYIGPQRKKYKAEAGSTEANTASILTGIARTQVLDATERARIAEEKSDRCELRMDQLEDNLRAEVRRRQRSEAKVASLSEGLREMHTWVHSATVVAALTRDGLTPPKVAHLIYDSDEDDR